MTTELSRRALAIAGAGAGIGLAAAGLGLEPAAAGRRCRKPIALRFGAERGTIESSRITMSGVRHAVKFHPDGTIEAVADHATLIPAPGTTVLYQLTGQVAAASGDRGFLTFETFAVSFQATGGSHDPATGSLVLDGAMVDSSSAGASGASRGSAIIAQTIESGCWI